jgi:adenine deaminase
MNPHSPGASFDPIAWRRRLAVALRQAPADLLVRGARIVNVFTEELEDVNIAIVDGRIAAVGDYTKGSETLDLPGRIVAPSFIDAHLHLESSLLWAPEFARAVVPHGTGGVVTDPHEIANVCGLAGIDAVRTATAGLPLHIRFTIPSCVPASEHESSGARLEADEIAEALAWPETVGLGELMNFPGVIAGTDLIAGKLAASFGRRIDGHSPYLRGDALQAYAGSGPASDHEATTLEEAREKLRLGMMIMIREGTTEHNLFDLLPLVTDKTYPRCCFSSDDRDCHDLLHRGHLDDTLRKAVKAGLDPLRAVRMATWNVADYWRLDGIGAIAPGYEANLVVLEDLTDFKVTMTLFQGKVVARDGALVVDLPPSPIPPLFHNTIRTGPVMIRDFRLAPEDARCAIEAIPGQIVTRFIEVEPTVVNGEAVSDPSRDLLKIVSVERHFASGRIGVGLARGFGLTRGALASTIAHDAHNIVAIGVDDGDLLAAIATVAESQGGLAVVADGKVIAHLPLPVAGLLSDQPLADVAAAYDELESAARALGSTLPSPFGLLAFMSLSVIPEARVTDRGFLRV